MHLILADAVLGFMVLSFGIECLEEMRWRYLVDEEAAPTVIVRNVDIACRRNYRFRVRLENAGALYDACCASECSIELHHVHFIPKSDLVPHCVGVDGYLHQAAGVRFKIGACRRR